MPVTETQRIEIMLAGQGDHVAFEALVAPRRERMRLLLAAVLGDWHEAEDALQDALLRAYRDLHRLRDPGAFDAWLRALAVNVARDRLRAIVSLRHREGVLGGGLADIERLASVAQEAHGVDPEGAARVLDRITSLPNGQRRVASLVWVAGVPPKEAAAGRRDRRRRGPGCGVPCCSRHVDGRAAGASGFRAGLPHAREHAALAR